MALPSLPPPFSAAERMIGNEQTSVHKEACRARKPLPRAPHPTASAFFDAHDDEVETPTSDNGSKVAAIRHSLGWRTRHASSALYPLTILPVEGRRGEGEARGDEAASFCVRQVFPRQSHRDQKCENGACGGHGRGSSQSSVEVDNWYGTGATVWPGALVLIKYLERMAHAPHRENIMSGKSVLDLGSGTAITSIAAALLGADSVTCTDGCAPVVELARGNIEAAIATLEGSVRTAESVDSHDTNALSTHDLRGCQMRAQAYRWGDSLSMEGAPSAMRDNQRHFDIILGADCLVPKLYPIAPLIDAIDELSGIDTVTYLSFEQRHYTEYDPATEFRRLAAERNLAVEVVPESEMHPMFMADDIQIWIVTRGGDDVRPTEKADTMTATCSKGSSSNNHQSLLA